MSDVLDMDGQVLEYGDPIIVPGHGLMTVVGLSEVCGVDVVLTGKVNNGDLASPWCEQASWVVKQ